METGKKINSLYLTRRMITILFLGFSSGLPFPLLMGTLQAWLTNEGTSLEVLGILGLIRGVPYDVHLPKVLPKSRLWSADW